MADVMTDLYHALPRLSATETRIAQVLIEHQDEVIDWTIAELASLTGASQASIARFCQGLGYSGYREFRLAAAASASRAQAVRERYQVSKSEIDPGDSVHDVVAKIAFQEARAVEDTARSIDTQVLDDVANLVARAPLIQLCGVGSSNLTAQDFQQKLSRIGIHAVCAVDMHLSLAGAALQKPKNVVFGVSYSGETTETNHAISVAKAAGATTVAITNVPESTLAGMCDYVLTAQARDNFHRAGAMASRIAQLVIVDLLFVRIAQRTYDRSNEALRLTRVAVNANST